MKKILIILLLSSLVSLVWAQTTIRVSVPAYADSTKESFERIVQDFEAANPDIKVDLEVGAWSAWQQKLQTEFFSGGNADVIYSTRAWIPTYVAEGKLANLDSYLTSADKSQFPASLLEGAKVDGKQYALPSVTSARILYVNMDLLKKAGFNKAPRTWDELKTAACAVGKKTDAAGFGIHGKEVEMEAYFFYVLWNYGGDVLDKNVGGTKSILNSSAARKAATFYANLIKNGCSQKNVTSYNREDLQELFKQGKLAMMITHGVLADEIKNGGFNINYLLTDVPGMKANKKGVTLGVIDAVHVSENSQHKKEAVKFLMFSFKPEYQADWVGKANLLPVTVAAGKEKVFDKDNLQAMIKAVPNAKFSFIHDKSTQIIDILKNELQALYTGKSSPRRAMANAHRRINRLVR